MWFLLGAEPVVNPVEGGFSAYEKAGFAGLFVFVFLVVLGFLLYALRNERAENKNLVEHNAEQMKQMIERSATALGEAAKTGQQVMQTSEKMNEAFEKLSKQMSEFLVYQQARDDFERRGRR